MYFSNSVALIGGFIVSQHVQGQCDVDIENNRRQTPLLLAIGQGHAGVIDLFVAKGADVNAVDEDGDSSLHLALMRQNVYTTTSPELMDLVSIRCTLPH